MTPSPDSSYRLIPLSRGLFTKVSPEDYEWLSRWKWYASPHKSGDFYANRSVWVKGEDRSTYVAMHRLIVGLDKGDKRQVDHINGDKLDNRRSNLRICSLQENALNCCARSHNKSGIKGVRFDSTRRGTKRWNARIKSKHLGWFYTAEEAHAAYCKAASALFGEFARFS